MEEYIEEYFHALILQQIDRAKSDIYGHAFMPLLRSEVHLTLFFENSNITGHNRIIWN